METIVIDHLVAHGFTKEQAESLAHSFHPKADVDVLATKADLKDLELRITKELTDRMIQLNNRTMTFTGIATGFLALLITYFQFTG